MTGATAEPSGESLKATPPPADHDSRSLGGLTTAARMTPAQRRERASKAARARWARENAEREAAGLPPTNPSPSPVGDDELDEGYRLVRLRFPDYQWPADGVARRRQAIALLRERAARAAAEAFRGHGGTE